MAKNCHFEAKNGLSEAKNGLFFNQWAFFTVSGKKWAKIALPEAKNRVSGPGGVEIALQRRRADREKKAKKSISWGLGHFSGQKWPFRPPNSDKRPLIAKKGQKLPSQGQKMAIRGSKTSFRGKKWQFGAKNGQFGAIYRVFSGNGQKLTFFCIFLGFPPKSALFGAGFATLRLENVFFGVRFRGPPGGPFSGVFSELQSAPCG